MEFRCILFLDTSESDVLGASRCIRNVWFLEYTSEMPDLGPSRCTETLVSVGDTSGLRYQCPSRCTKVQYQVKYTSGWANIGHFRCIAKNCQKLPKQNTSEFSNFIQSRCISLISREYTRSPSRSISPRKQVKHKKYIGIQHIIAIPMYFINYLRFYLLSRAVFMSCILPRCSGYARWD